jgi:hypothetical protein
MFSIYADMTDAERQVAGYLTNLGLYWIYQSPVFLYDEKKRPRVWTPDFYIPKLGIYIEVCGSKRFNYKYRERIYLDNNIPVVFLHYYKIQEKWQVFMVKRIKEIEMQRHFDAMKILDKINI